MWFCAYKWTKDQTVTAKADIHHLIVQRWWSGDEECCHTLSSELHLSPPPGLGESGFSTDASKQGKCDHTLTDALVSNWMEKITVTFQKMVHLIRVWKGAVLNDESHQYLPSLQLQVTVMRHRTDNLDHTLFNLRVKKTQVIKFFRN